MPESKEVNTVKKDKKVKTRVILVLAAIIIILIGAYISYRGTYLETIELGENFGQVFSQKLVYQYTTIAINFVILFIAISLTNRGIKKGLKAFFDEEKKEIPKLPNKSIAFIIAAIVSIIVSNSMLEQVTLFINRTLFGITDKVFNMDIAFYIFTKPFLELITLYFIGIIIGLTIYTAIYYIVIFNVHFDGINAQTLKKNNLLKQLTKYVMLISIGFAAFIVVNTQGLINQKFLILNDNTSTAIYGAGITDVTIKLWGYRILAVVIVAAVYRAIKGFKEKNTKKMITSIVIVPIYLVVLFVLMIGFKLIYINTNELDKEKQYIAENIENTKSAYGIKIDEFSIDDSNATDLSEIEENQDLTNKITIVNEDITLKTIGVTQTSTGYYKFRNSNINRYKVNGEEQVVYISPREIVSGGDRTYNNNTYEYTHGFGTVITSATSADETGNIKYIQKDFVSQNQVINISQPRIYFGLETNNTIVTNTNNKSEFDFPTTTSQNSEYTYDGKAGLSLNFIDRMILAIKEKDINLAFSSNVTKDSKILVNRNIRERAKKIMPYLLYDEDPYMVISDEGKLVWVIDAYTVTDKYPYSQHSTIEYENYKLDINYIRNSVKVLIDAYDGTMKFYITDKTDPIVVAYQKMYPDIFVEETIPQDIASHFTYPKFLYNIQANVLERYHNVSTDVLYRSDDVWEIAKYSKTNTTSTSAKGTKQEPYYTMLKTIDSDKYELGLVVPYTQLGKQSLKAYLVGTYDENGNSKMRLYKFSQDTNMLGPMQLETLLGQDENISKELESLNVSGTKTIKNIIAVPINNSVLYVQPIYQLSLNEAKSTPPVLKKVIVAAGNKLAIDDTLKGAVRKLLSQSALNIEIENTDTIDDLVNTIIKANNNLETSTDSKDWEMIGKDLKKLQELINKLQILQDEKTKEEAKTKTNNLINQNTISNVIQ